MSGVEYLLFMNIVIDQSTARIREACRFSRQQNIYPGVIVSSAQLSTPMRPPA